MKIPDDIRLKLAKDFGRDDVAMVETQLALFADAYQLQEGSPPSDRLIRCVVHLAGGSKLALAEIVRTALVDWRDVIRAVEYNERDEQVRDLTLLFDEALAPQTRNNATERDSAAPITIVTGFIHAMNQWERKSWEASRAVRGTTDPESYWPEVHANLDQVFSQFCTPKKRPHGRAESFQRPPEYDPATERVVGCEIVGKRANVDTEWVAPLGGGTYRYVLHDSGGVWRIDNVKLKSADKWISAIL